MLFQALNNSVIDSTTKGVLSNASPLLVFRFCNGRRGGLAAACQGSIGHEDCLEECWTPDRGRGTTTKASREHQRGKKKQEEGSHNSDVVSTTCSLRNLVRSSAGRYACTPGGQVVPIFFGASHMPQVLQQQYAHMWAPTIVLILIPPGSYVVDWEDFLVNSTSENTSADVSFFEREVSYDTFGGNYHLADELILFIGGNPFHGMVQSSSSLGLHLNSSSRKTGSKKPLFGGPSFGKPPFGKPPFDPKGGGGGSGSFFT
ncbi:hypothetical protein [Hyalangium minutum]|uniref:Uncharacterized protein n=1 Tax=Hyalangium minutum TaxID=394096 RepID=A0A085VZ33_9BACT|nr:hypothetical protein [Hyalangium minutum]KFE58458.1 hypothetical protein DB31_6724 [Hyalangium minutum]KFE60696.1 hypothetical protein DB31_4878 [Hyalangium minutum]